VRGRKYKLSIKEGLMVMERFTSPRRAPVGEGTFFDEKRMIID